MMRWPLRYQIMLPMAVAMLVAIAGLSVTNAYLAGHRTTSVIERQVAEVTRTLAESNFPLTQQVLKQMQGLSGAHFVLVDPQGRELAASSDVKIADLPPAGQAASDERLRFMEPVDLGGRRYYAAVLDLPRRHPSGRRQILHVLYPEHAYQDAWQQAVEPPLIIGLVSLAVVALIGVAIAARVSRPMTRLRQQIGLIAEGSFVPLSLPHRNDEVRDLAVAVNRMAEMLARYEQEVRQAERIHTLGHLVRGIAHQLRNSATGAQMAIDIHRDECPIAQSTESLDVAARQLALIEKYLQKFLSLDTRSTAGYTDVDVVDLLHSLVPLLRPTAKHVGVQLNVNAPPYPLHVEGNSDALEHVLLNLLWNAIEAAGQLQDVDASQSPNVEVSFQCCETGFLELVVEDTGPGPVEEIAAAMFEPFTTNKAHGTGLGLSLAKNIVVAHGGNIVWERRGTRTRFTVRLPLNVRKAVRGETTGH